MKSLLVSVLIVLSPIVIAAELTAPKISPEEVASAKNIMRLEHAIVEAKKAEQELADWDKRGMKFDIPLGQLINLAKTTGNGARGNTAGRASSAAMDAAKSTIIEVTGGPNEFSKNLNLELERSKNRHKNFNDDDISTVKGLKDLIDKPAKTGSVAIGNAGIAAYAKVAGDLQAETLRQFASLQAKVARAQLKLNEAIEANDLFQEEQRRKEKLR
jgi:hypothetical protein